MKFDVLYNLFFLVGQKKHLRLFGLLVAEMGQKAAGIGTIEISV